MHESTGKQTNKQTNKQRKVHNYTKKQVDFFWNWKSDNNKVLTWMYCMYLC